MSNNALFLDRDGVINIDHGYVHQKENFNFIDGIFDLVKMANKHHFKVIVVTNQAGIARGRQNPHSPLHVVLRREDFSGARRQQCRGGV